jgi:ferredoxin-NADP reductase
VPVWEPATVVGVHDETATAKTLRFRLTHPSTHLPGQHYVVRLSSPDGYAAMRSYSVASAPDGSAEIDLTIERLEDGEVSTFLHDEVVVGDDIELRGPIGGWFVWKGDLPALLIGGGSGVVPLMAMLRYARQLGLTEMARMVVSVRTPDDLYYPSELTGPEVDVIYTRRTPPEYVRPPGRLRETDLEGLLPSDGVAYICGSPQFSDAATDVATATGISENRIRIERFGPT